MSKQLSDEVQKLILDNQTLIHLCLRQNNIHPSPNEYEDIVSIGTIGLIKAAINYDPLRGNTFATCAMTYIRNEIMQYINKMQRIPPISSINEPLFTDENGKDITVEDSIQDPKSNFADNLTTQSELIRIVNIILNVPKSQYKIVLLYRMAGLKHANISNVLNTSRTNVIHREKSGREKILQTLRLGSYDKEFSMSIKDDEYQFTSPRQTIKDFEQIFAKLQKSTPVAKLTRNQEQYIIHLPPDPTSFVFMAEMFRILSSKTPDSTKPNRMS